MSLAAPSSLGVILSDDLLWSSRITSTAQALGLQVKAVRTLEQIEKLAREMTLTLVILDLGAKGVRPDMIVPQVSAAGAQRPRFVAFGSHVDVASLDAARAAGCDPVLPRSKVAAELPALLEEWMRDGGSASRR